MGRDENGDAVFARLVDQQAPEFVTRQGIDAGGRLVEDQKFGPVHERHGEGEALPDAERQIGGERVAMTFESETHHQIRDPRARLVSRQLEQAGVQIEILCDGQFGIKGEALRHVADPAARRHAARLHGLAKQPSRALARRQQAGEHFHGRGLAAAVRAKKAENLPASDVEIDVIDRREIAETAGQPPRRDYRRLAIVVARRNDKLVRLPALFFREQSDKGVLDARGAGPRLDLGGRAGGENFSGVEDNDEIEALGLFHIGGGDDHAHRFRRAEAHAVHQLPELAPRQRIDAGGRLVEDQQFRIVDQSAAQAKLLLHAA